MLDLFVRFKSLHWTAAKHCSYIQTSPWHPMPFSIFQPPLPAQKETPIQPPSRKMEPCPDLNIYGPWYLLTKCLKIKHFPIRKLNDHWLHCKWRFCTPPGCRWDVVSTRSQMLLPGETMKPMDLKWWSRLGSFGGPREIWMKGPLLALVNHQLEPLVIGSVT